MPPRRRVVRRSGESGQATLEHVGLVMVVALLVAGVVAAFAVNAAAVSGGAARAICLVLTLGQGDCGAAAPEQAADRQPTTPCQIGGAGDSVALGLDFTFVEVGADRGIRWEERSDGTYRVQQTMGSSAGGTVGAGAQLSFTVADTAVGVGASAGLSGGVTFQGGREWTVGSEAEKDRLVSAENWGRVDQVVQNVPGGSALTALRDAVGLGETFPPPDRVFIALGAYADAGAYAGADGAASARAGANASTLVGYSHSPDEPDEQTYYYRTTTSAKALAGVTGLGESNGASLEGSVETMTTVTVRDGDIVRASRSGIATGQSGGLTNALFGGEPTLGTGTSVSDGVQYDAVLDVRSDADRRAVADLVTSAALDLTDTTVVGRFDPTGTADPLGSVFTTAVRDRGDLTRVGVTPGGSTPFAGDVSVAAGPVAGVNGGYSTSTMAYDNPEYFDGTDFAARTNC